MSVKIHLENILDAERSLRNAEKSFFAGSSEKEQSELLSSAVEVALKEPELDEKVLRLERLADLCAQVPGAKMADSLLKILNTTESSVRVSAGEALLDVAFDRYAEVARAIERLFEQEVSGPALRELPWLIAEVGEPSALPLLRRFLTHADAEVVASAIEACVQLGDHGAIAELKPLRDDKRMVELADGDVRVPISELVEEAIDNLKA